MNGAQQPGAVRVQRGNSISQMEQDLIGKEQRNTMNDGSAVHRMEQDLVAKERARHGDDGSIATSRYQDDRSIITAQSGEGTMYRMERDLLGRGGGGASVSGSTVATRAGSVYRMEQDLLSKEMARNGDASSVATGTSRRSLVQMEQALLNKERELGVGHSTDESVAGSSTAAGSLARMERDLLSRYPVAPGSDEDDSRTAADSLGRMEQGFLSAAGSFLSSINLFMGSNFLHRYGCAH